MPRVKSGCTEVFLLRYSHLIRAVLARPWAIDANSPEWGAILEVLELRAAGERLTEQEITARLAAAVVSNGPRAGGGTSGAVRVIPLYGVISPRLGLMGDMSGGTTAEGFGRSFMEAVRDPEITAIVVDVDSPGGNVAGIEEAAALVRSQRGVKPISAVAAFRMASAAYYIGAQADEVVASPSSEVGSIGVLGMHQDVSEAEAKLGIKVTLISAGKYKTEANPHIPLTEEAKAAWQADADRYYAMFVNAVAKGRGVSADTVRSDFGQGRTLMARPALAAGMVDRIDTLQGTIDRALAGKIRMRPVGNAAEASAEGFTVRADARLAAVDDATASPPESQPVDESDEDDAAPAVPDEPGEAEPVPTPPPDEPADAGSNPSAQARARHDLEITEALLRGGHSGWLQ